MQDKEFLDQLENIASELYRDGHEVAALRMGDELDDIYKGLTYLDKYKKLYSHLLEKTRETATQTSYPILCEHGEDFRDCPECYQQHRQQLLGSS